MNITILILAPLALAAPKKDRPHFDPHYKCAVIETTKIRGGVLDGTDYEKELAKIELFVTDEGNPETGAIAKQAFADGHEFTATWSVNLTEREKGMQSLAITMDDRLLFETEFNRKRNRDTYTVPATKALRVDCHP